MQAKRAKSAEKQVKPGRIHAVLATLGREIAQGIIQPGAVLPPEHELESRLGVSRGVVREAIKTLSGKGLVSVRPRHGTRVLPRSDWSLLDRDVLNWLVGQDKPDRALLLYVQEVRSIIEPAAAALAATRATKSDLQHIKAALEAMQASDSQASATAADKAFSPRNSGRHAQSVLQGFRGAIDTILSAVFVVAVDKVDGWFDGNLPTMSSPRERSKKATPQKRGRLWSRSLASPSRDCRG